MQLSRAYYVPLDEERAIYMAAPATAVATNRSGSDGGSDGGVALRVGALDADDEDDQSSTHVAMARMARPRGARRLAEATRDRDGMRAHDAVDEALDAQLHRAAGRRLETGEGEARRAREREVYRQGVALYERRRRNAAEQLSALAPPSQPPSSSSTHSSPASPSRLHAALE